ncbi:MAG: nucleotide exchange factor GrpE [Cyclobacteriaceae bacterium]
MKKEQEEKELVNEEVENQEKTQLNQEETVEESEQTEEPTHEDQLNEAKDKYLRLYSEFENFRRRTSKEKLDLISTANKGLMADLLPVLDDFERAMSASKENKDEKAFREGVELIQNKLTKSLETKGLKKMKVKKGDKFDDEKHEAITQIPTEKKLEGKVVDTVEAGYYLGDTVVRFAKVVVGAKQ